MATIQGIGHMAEFLQEHETWTSYVERFENYCTANQIPDDRKRAALLTVIGISTYQLLKSLCAPVSPTVKTYEQLVSILKNHLQPAPSIISERYKFHRASQLETESVRDFIVRIQSLTVHCNFANNLKEALRDRFVCGLKSDRIRERLLESGNPTFDEATQLALKLDAAAKEATTLGKDHRDRTAHNVVSFMKPGTATGRVHAKKKREQDVKKYACFSCGLSNHTRDKCKYRDYVCNKCNTKGHLGKVCKVKSVPSKSKSQKFMTDVENNSDSSGSNTMNHLHSTYSTSNVLQHRTNSNGISPIRKVVNIQNVLVNMEIDTGSAVSAISQGYYRKHFSTLSLQPTNLLLRSYTGEEIVPVGRLQVEASIPGQLPVQGLQLYIIPGGGPPLLGREWMFKLSINSWDVSNLNSLGSDPKGCLESTQVEEVITAFPEVFSEGLGTYKKPPSKLYLKPGTVPVFQKARYLPYAMKPEVEAELNRLVETGAISQVTHSEWATPIVPVLKKGGGVRICGDYKITLNPNLVIDKYPVPKIDDLFATLQNGQCFSKLDLSHAYQQLLLDEDSKECVTINTHKGLFRHNRIPYGVASAPGLFQRVMEQTLQGLPGVVVFLDDILVTGKNSEEHLARLRAVLQRLQDAGLKVKRNKCVFFSKSVSYLGHVIDSQGLHTDPQKVEAIVNAPIPQDISQLRAVLGLVNYYAKFIPRLASHLKPLYQLLEKDKEFKFDKPCIEAFRQIKREFSSATILTHYDPAKPLKVATDASPYGLGAVISHILPNGQEKPIAYASRTLNKAEQNYSQLDKEALSLYWGVKKFYQYLYGRHFVLETDHKPLTSIFGPKNGIPPMAASRLQRYAVFLAGFDFEIKYVKSESNVADAFSRVPLTHSRIESSAISYLHYLDEGNVPIHSKQIAATTRKDTTMNQVLGFVQYGWPGNVDQIREEFIPYFRKRLELTIEQGCLMWGYRVVIPKALQKRLLEELHDSHLGIVKMKAMARAYFWWPGLDSDIQDLVASCPQCLCNRNDPPKHTLHVWDYPVKPFARIHMDFLGPFQGRMILIVTDAYSKWLEAFEVSSTSAAQTIQKLRVLFAQFGLPQHIVTDNGPPFSSQEFRTFLESNGIKHTFSPPYHPSTNGLAENHVKTFKSKVLAAVQEGKDFHLAVSRFLLAYRSTVHCTTNETPAKLFLGRQLRTRLDCIKPDVREHVADQQHKQIEGHKGSRQVTFQKGQSVLVKDYRGRKACWVPGTISQCLGPVTYSVMIDNDATRIWKRHANQLLEFRGSKKPVIINVENNVDVGNTVTTHDYLPPLLSEPNVQDETIVMEPNNQEIVNDDSNVHEPNDNVNLVNEENIVTSSPQRRYPVRVRKPKVKMNL